MFIVAHVLPDSVKYDNDITSTSSASNMLIVPVSGSSKIAGRRGRRLLPCLYFLLHKCFPGRCLFRVLDVYKRQIVNADAHLGGGMDGFLMGYADDVLQLAVYFGQVGTGKVNLIDDGDNGQVQIHRCV